MLYNRGEFELFAGETMVAFRSLTPDSIQTNLEATAIAHEESVWFKSSVMGIDPRNFQLDYVVPEPVDGSEQNGEKALFDAQQKLLTVYMMMGTDASAFGSYLPLEQKVSATEMALEENETFLLRRCAESGMNPEDIEKGWTAGEDGDPELEVYAARVFLLQEILDDLNA